MPKKRLATAVKKQKGSYINQPGRENKREPEPPKGWPEKTEVVLADPLACEKWDDTCKLLDEMNVLTVADRDLLELFCINWSQYIALVKSVAKMGIVNQYEDSKGNQITKRSAYQAELGRIADRQQKLLLEFGLTPSSRSKLVTIKDTKTESPFEKWIERGGLN